MKTQFVNPESTKTSVATDPNVEWSGVEFSKAKKQLLAWEVLDPCCFSLPSVICVYQALRMLLDAGANEIRAMETWAALVGWDIFGLGTLRLY